MMNLIKLEFDLNYFKEYNALYSAQHFTDCQIVTRDAIFNVHRLFLAAASPVLSKVFQELGSHVEDPVVLMPDFDLAEMTSFLNLVYGVPKPDDLLPVSLAVIEQILNLSVDGSDRRNAQKTHTVVDQSLPEATRDLMSLNHRMKFDKDEQDTRRKIGETLRQRQNNPRRSKKCFLCATIKKSQGELLDHVRQDHGQDIFDCTLDLLTDLKLKTYSCCDKVFFDKQRWSRHRLQVHVKVVSTIRQPLQCSACEHSFVFTQELEDVTYHNNPASLTNYRCPLGCQQMFKSRKDLTEHFESCLLLQKVLCPFCGDFLFHEKAKKDELPLKIKPFRRRVRQRTNNCHICMENFPRFENLELHLKKAHNVFTEYPCKQCDRVFASLKKLNLHQNLHEGRFACSKCGKLFDHKTALTAHEALHARREHECYVCSKAFYTPQRLMDHLNTHSGERPHRCDQCDFASVLPSGLAHHKKRLHRQVR